MRGEQKATGLPHETDFCFNKLLCFFEASSQGSKYLTCTSPTARAMPSLLKMQRQTKIQIFPLFHRILTSNLSMNERIKPNQQLF